MNCKTTFIIALIASLVFSLGSVNVHVSAVKCEDIKGVEKWNPEGHDDNNPSESKFYKALEEKTFCEVNKEIDHMIIKGEIKEDTKHDMDWFEQTIMYQSVDEESQDCMRDAYFDSPDSSGDDNLADYEMVECTY